MEDTDPDEEIFLQTPRSTLRRFCNFLIQIVCVYDFLWTSGPKNSTVGIVLGFEIWLNFFFPLKLVEVLIRFSF
jgi:hypothetical protein